MNNATNKKENRKALRFFIPFLIVMAFGGGVIGVLSTTDSASRVSQRITSFLEAFMYFVSPYMVIIFILAGIITALIYYRRGKKEYKNMLDSDDEDIQDMFYRNADCNLAKMMTYMSICDISAFIFFAVVVTYIRQYVENNLDIYLIALLVFVVGNFIRMRLQQLSVDLIKTMNPGKKGSAFDLRFQKKWEESCDEMEKFQIYKASYKAYKTGSMACVIIFVSLLLLSFFFDYGPLPAMAVGAIWMVNTVSYCRESMKLEKEKLNL